MNRIDILSNRRTVLTALLTILLAGATPSLAQGPNIPAEDPESTAFEAGDDDSFGPGGARRLERLARRLDLNDEQSDAIAKIHESGRARDLPLRKQMRLLRHELQGEMMKDDPSEKTVVALTREMGELRTKIQTGHLQDRLAVRANLTAEQRDRMLMMGGQGRGSRHGGPRGGAMCGAQGRQGWNGRDCRNGADCDGSGPGQHRPGDGPRGRAGRQGRNSD